MFSSISSNLKYYLNQKINNKKVIIGEKNKNNEELYSKYLITDRERFIIEEISEGLSHKEIAEKLNISINTVRSHLHRIYRKCNVQNKTGLLKLLCYS